MSYDLCSGTTTPDPCAEPALKSAPVTTLTRRMTWKEAKALAPAGAVAAVVAERERDDCDSQTDYFNVVTERRVLIGWRMTRKESFANLRKSAARFEETAHLGPGRDLWTSRVVLLDDVVPSMAGCAYWRGSSSHWHSELDGGYRGATFTTETEARAFAAEKGEPEPIGFQTKDGLQTVHFGWGFWRESVEHRENYSMGSGNYLKAGSSYGSGWAVSSSALSSTYPNESETVEVAPCVLRGRGAR